MKKNLVKGFNYASPGSITAYPISAVDCNENLNEHFPSLPGNAEDKLVEHVAGTLSNFGLIRNGKGFHTSYFIH